VSETWEIWVNILEKACAKMVGSFEAMEGGKPCSAFMSLTGFPSDVLRHKNVSVEELWNFVIKSAVLNQPTTCSVNLNIGGDFGQK